MGQDLEIIKKMYDAVAHEYASTFAGEHDKKPMDQEILQRFKEEIGHRKPVWDFGCGPGQTTRYLTDLGIDISGIDLSEDMIQQARSNHPDIHFQKGDLLNLNFKNDSIDGIVLFYAIVHFAEDQVVTTFKEIFRVLRGGGITLLTFHIGEETMHIDEFLGIDIDIDFMFFTTDFISESLKKCGFQVTDLIEREPYPEIEYQSRRAYVFARKPE